MKKYLCLMLSVMLMALSFAGCGDMSESSEDTPDYAKQTGSGESYVATVGDDDATIEYLGATLDINEGEFDDEEDLDGSRYFCLKMTFTNDMSYVSEDDDGDEDIYKDSLDNAFVVQAVQDDEVIEPRGPGETETIEEDNVYERIDQASSVECEYYFPVDPEKPVTIHVLNPDGEDTVMAELTFQPEEDDF